MKFIIFITISMLSFFTCQTNASDKVFSYTMEEMYEMAASFKAIREGEDLVASDVMKASEFKGYIASTIDNSESFNECARKLPVNVIAGRAAIVITSSPLDRSRLAVFSVLVGLTYACE